MEVYVIITSLNYDRESYNVIGVYSTIDKAEKAANYYINNFADDEFKKNGIIYAYKTKMDSYSFED